MIKNWSDDYLPQAVERAEYHCSGGGTHCGHSEKWWEAARQAKGGDIIYCERCGQFLVKANGLPWILKKTIGYDYKKKKTPSFRSNHLNDVFYYSIDPRFQINGNTQRKR